MPLPSPSPIRSRSSVLAPLAVLTVLLIAYFGIVGKTRLLNDADTLWHTIVGKKILESGFATTDTFSFSFRGDEWIANQWLAECLLAAWDYAGGFDGILCWTVFILTCIYAALSLRYLCQGIDPILTAAFLTLVISASAYTLHSRPHIFSIAALGAVFVVLRDVEQRKRRLSTLLWLIPLCVLWSNLHGGVLGGVGTIGLATGAWTGLWLIRRDSPVAHARDLLLVWTVVVGCLAALVVTPFGYGSLSTWITIMHLPLRDLVTEHAPLAPGSVEGLTVLLLAVVYALVLAATPRAWPKATFWLPVVWFFLTWSRIRHAPLFAIVAGIALADLLPQSALAGWLVRRGWLRPVGEASGAFPPERYGRVVGRLLILVLLVMTPLFASAVWLEHVGPLPLVGRGWARPTPRVWPAEMIEPLAEFADGHPDGTPIFNEPILGGFLIYNFPRLRVFIDGRCELYGEQFLRNFVAAWQRPEMVGDWQREYGFRAALIEAESPLMPYFRATAAWRLVRRCDTASFFVYEQ